MKRKTQTMKTIGDKKVYSANTPNGWSIVIMPDNILIDNYHIDEAHIHPEPEKHIIKEDIKEQDPEKILAIVLIHLNNNNGLNLSLLKKELLK